MLVGKLEPGNGKSWRLIGAAPAFRQSDDEHRIHNARQERCGERAGQGHASAASARRWRVDSGVSFSVYWFGFIAVKITTSGNT